MKRISLFSGLGLLVIASLSTNAAFAQLNTAYVSGTGNDANPCLQTSPCQSFNTAVGKLVTGGKIVCLDATLVNTVTINKALTIDCAQGYGTVTTSSNVSSVTVAAGPSDKVIIRNLHIHGAGTGSDNGISYVSGGELELDNVTIMGVNSVGAGLNVVTSGFAVLSVRNSSFSRMVIGIKLNASAANVVASVTNTTFNNLSNTGIEVGPNAYIGVSNSVFSAVLGYAINARSNTATVYANDNVFTNNNIGMSATVAGAKINATGNKLFGNSRAFNVAAGATFLSGGDNKIDINPGNPSTGALTSR